MPTNDYMTPEISKVIPMLTQTCGELTRQTLIRALTEKTQEWVEGDPELADVLLEGKKTLEECVRYVTEKAAVIVSKNLNSMLNAEFENFPKMKIQGQEATMAGTAVDSEQVFKWAQEYYYTPDAKATDFKKEAERKAEEAKRKAEAAKKKAEADKKAAAKKAADAKKDKAKKDADKKDDTDNPDTKAEAGAEQPPDTSRGAAKDKNAMQGGEQISMFGPPQAAA